MIEDPSLKTSGSHIPYDQALNPAQREAVLATEGPLLVIAGAGSGKTRTLTYRVAHLVEQGCPPDAILLLTFTRKAAQEMLQRATRLLDDRCTGVAGGTFHSFANTMLRRHAGRLGFSSGFSILDRPDAESLIGMLRKEIGPGDTQHNLPRKQTLMNIFSRAVNKAEAVEDIVYEDYPHFSHCLEEIILLATRYAERKRQLQLLDYDDLLVYMHRLLSTDAEVRARIAAAYRYVMVDEFQDTNPLQAEIVYLITDQRRNVMVVGDDSQSIYAFRGADVKNILRFPQRFRDARILRLEENYRSSQPILDLANVVIDQAGEKYTKVLFSRREKGSAPVLLRAADENCQSRFIVRRILELRDQGVDLERIAVLFRASFHAFDLEIELSRAGLGFVKVGGFKFVEAAHIKDVLAHLKVIANGNDRVSWARILLLLEKVGPRTADTICNAIAAEGSGFAGIATARLKPGPAKSIERLKALYAAVDDPALSLPALGEAVLQYYTPILKSRYDDHPKRLRDLEQIVTIMERYGSLEEFLSDMALEPPNTAVEETFTTHRSDPARLTLSTIHSAKGLEWHTVFVIWTLDGKFPSVRSLQKEEDVEEELRLLYVAATRAQENLYFTYPSQAFDRGAGMLLTRPCRFLADIPEDILAHETASY